MTNSEMIQKLETDGLSSVSDMDFITNALKENTKLKAEIEQLKSEFETYYKLYLASIDARQILTECVERLKSRNCQTCANKGKCAIFDNFNIDYCSDWEKGGNNGNYKNR